MRIPADLVDRLVAAARRASERAYCPYSRFPVGAAVLTEDGGIHAGCNVENASYGLTMCAERNAIFLAVASSPGEPRVRCVVIYTPTEEPTAPCGACRQVIREFGPDAEVISTCDTPAVLCSSTRELLPESFGPEAIGVLSEKEANHGSE
ncbi:MAG: cytidine deaminase [Planctomycetes bacterium]|nr:cytidine deaminase [Planctomycetota bacterium]